MHSSSFVSRLVPVVSLLALLAVAVSPASAAPQTEAAPLTPAVPNATPFDLVTGAATQDFSTLGTFTLPSGATITLEFDVTVDSVIPAGVSAVANQANVGADQLMAAVPSNDPTTGAADDPTVTMLLEVAEMGITKSDAPASTTAVPGNPITYNVVVTNGGPFGVNDAEVTDLFPAALSNCSWACAGTGNCDTTNGMGDITAVTVDLEVGESVTFMITCDVDPGATGTLTNTATVDPPDGFADPGVDPNMASDVNDLAPTGDLSVDKTTDTTPVVPGSPIQYTIVVANSGPSDATGVGFDDTFPAEVSGVTWTCSGAGGATCPNAAGAGDVSETVDLPAGGSLTYTVNGVVDGGASGSIANTAALTVPAGFTDTDSSNDSDTVVDSVDPMVDVGVTKTTLTSPVVAGAPVQYQIVVDNGGPSDASGVGVGDAFPAALSNVTWTCSASAGSSCGAAAGNGDLSESVDVAAGGSVTFTVTADLAPDASGTLTNTATVTPPAGATDATTGDDSSTAMDPIVAQGDLAIDKTTLTSPVVAGLPVSYQMVVTNTGPSTAAGALVQDNFPVTLSGVTWTCTASAGSACTAGPVAGDVLDMVTVAPGGTLTYDATGTLDGTAAGVLSNTATVSPPAGFTDTNPGNESDTVNDPIVQQADLTILKQAAPGPVLPGGTVSYTIVVTNLGPGDVTGATVTDVVPPELANPSWTCVADPGASCTAGPVAGDVNDTVDLPAGASVTYTLTATAAAIGSAINTANVAAPAGVIDPEPANDSSTVVVSLGQFIDIPTLSPLGIALLALLLGALGWWLLRRRGALAAGLALVLLVGFAGAAEAQTLVDDFAVAQGPNTDPPGGPPPSSSVAAAGLGGERDLAVDRVSGVGIVTGEVTGGAFEFDAPVATRGEATLTWDGADGDPDALDPTGLGGVDLTMTGQSGFRLTLDAADAGSELIVRVFTDGANHSQAARLVASAIAGPTDLFIPFAEFLPVAGSGADFTDVGAVVLVVRGEDVAAEIANFETAGPLLVVDKVDLDPNTNMEIGLNEVPAGSTIRYRVTIANQGGDATTVDVTDMVDANTTLVANTLNSTPVAVDDAYRTFGNVTLDVDGTPLPTLFANDADPDGDTFTITAFDAASAQGGTVSMVDTNTGAFQYEPPPGFTGVDSFTYTIEDDDGNASTATATVALLSTIWFVDSDACPGAPPCGTGTQADPFGALVQAEVASAPGDVIRLRQGAADTTNHNTGFLLKPDQRLLGEGVDLVIDGVHVEGNGPADGNLDPNPANRPSITSVAGPGLTLHDGVTVLGLNVVGTGGAGVSALGVDAPTTDHVDVVDSGDVALEAIGATNLALTFTGLDSLNSTTHGVLLDNVTGSLTVNGPTQLDDPAGAGVRIVNSPGFTAGFSAVNVVDAGGGMAHAAIHLESNAGATFTFGTLTLDSANGDGLFANNGGTVNHPGSGNTINAVGGAAVDIQSTTGNSGGSPGWSFDSLASAGSPDQGVRLVSLGDDFTVGAGGTTITDPNAVGILVENSAGRSFDFGDTSVTDTNVGAGATADGIDLTTGNAGATFTFDSLDVTTDGGAGLLANSSGTVNIAGTDGNSIVANGGPALDVTSTGAGAGWTFDTLSSTNSTGTGVNLVAFSGTVVGESGSITGSAGRAFNVDGGAPNSTYSGNVTQNAAQRVVNVEDTTGGTVAFNTGTVTGGAASTGVRIHNADGNASFADLNLGTSGSPMSNQALTLSGGSTGTFGFAGTQIFTTGARGVHADNGGVVEFTGPGNRVTATNARALTFENGTTIGPNGATFERIDASAADFGIVLSNAGSGFTVTGDGAVGAGIAANNDSGGTVMNTTDDGISLVNVSNVSLNYMRVQDAANHGIDGDDVTNFTLTRSNLVSNGNANLEHGLMLLNPAGTATVANVLGDGNFDAHLRVFNETGNNLTLFSVDDSVLQNVTTGFFEDGISFEAQTGVTTAISVTNSTFSNHDGDHVQASTNGATDATVTITGNTMTGAAGNLGAGITVNSADTYSGTTTFDISGNNLQKANDNSASINVNIGLSSAAGSYSGTISNNIIGTQGSADSAGDTGITVQVNDDATMTVLISGNTVREFDNNGISVSAVDGTGDMRATLTGNTVTSADANVFAALFVDVQTNNEICLDAGDDTGITPALENTFTASAGVSDVALRTGGTGVMNLEGYAGAASNAAQIETYMQNRNVGAPGVIISVAGGPIQGGGACATP